MALWLYCQSICLIINLPNKFYWADHLAYTDIDKRITIIRILHKQFENVWTGFRWLRTASSGGLLGSIECRKFLD